MNILTNILAAFGLSSSAGLNAYLPLLVVALAARFTHLIELKTPWDTLENPWVIAVLILLLAIEFFADKIPAINHANDFIQTIFRPTAGAILFASTTQVISNINPVLALILGLLAAGTVHVAKSAVMRPAVTATTGGLANPVVSLVEDATALVVSVLAVVLPVLLSAIIILLTALVIWWLWRRAVRERRPIVS
jgi:Domain of unknown function (DUF4126)